MTMARDRFSSYGTLLAESEVGTAYTEKKLTESGTISTVGSRGIFYGVSTQTGGTRLADNTSHIVDLPGLPKKIQFFKDVWHKRSSRSTVGSESLTCTPWRAYGGYESYRYVFWSKAQLTAAQRLYYYNQSAQIEPLYTSILPSILEEGCTKCMELKDTPRSDVRIDIAAFMAEVGDFRSLYTSLKGIGSLFSHLLKGGLKNYAHVSKALAAVSADARLQWSFAIKPLLADVRKLANQASAIDKRIAEWNAAADAKKHFVITVDMSHRLAGEIPSSRVCTTSIPHSVGEAWFYKHDWYSYVDYQESHSAKLLVHLGFRPERIKNVHLTKSLMHLDAQGFGDVFSTAWELTPFSFLVDYVYSVSKFIQQLDVTLSNLPMSGAYCAYSLETRRDTLCTVQESGGIGTSTQVDRTYQRKLLPQLPVVNTADSFFGLRTELLEFRMPKDGQLLNILALIVAFATNKRR